MSRLTYDDASASTGLNASEGFDDLFDAFEIRETAREIFRQYLEQLPSDLDREIALRLHHDGVSERATDQDILRLLQASDLQEIESLYGERVRLAAARGRDQGNYSALRCLVREVRRSREDARKCRIVMKGLFRQWNT